MDSVMIALLPINDEWCNIELPHLTLVFSGKITDHKPTDFNKMVKDATSLAMTCCPITLTVTGVEIMGPPEERVHALMFRPSPELMAMRHFVEKWNLSEWPDYKPHATIGPYGSNFGITPSLVAFNRLLVAWGDDQYIIGLKNY